MNEMVNRLRLKQTIIRRFVNDSDDEDNQECSLSCGSDIQILDSSGHSDSSSGPKSTHSVVSVNDRFTNFKVFVRKCGQNVERFVDLNGDNNPFIVDNTLDQLMGCKDFIQMADVLNKCRSESSSNLNDEEVSDEHNLDVVPKGDKSVLQNNETNNGTEFEMEAKELEMEGIRHMKASKLSSEAFKCYVCGIKIFGYQLAADHSKSDFHLKKKYGDDLKGIDAMFTIDSEAIGDVKVAIARRKLLGKIKSMDKELYYDHGIRIKDGFGDNAFVCLKCNLSLKSLDQMNKHFKSSKTLIRKTNVCPNDRSDNEEQTLDANISQLDIKLYSEGIKENQSSDATKFYCIFCNIYFECKRLAVTHISDFRHKKQRRGENLFGIDTRFTIESNRIDELDVAFARKTMLKSISLKTKSELSDQSIRLQDGIGSNAFFCQRCLFPIGSYEQIEEHIHSLTHKM